MSSLRLSELLVGLSRVADIGMGFAPGEAARAAVIAADLARELDLPEPSDLYYVTLLQHVGCTAYAHEAAALLGGDEIAVRAAAARTDFDDPGDVLRGYLPHLAPAGGAVARLRAAGVAALRARRITAGYSQANCEVAARIAHRVGLGPGVERGLTDVYEAWNGRGGPRGAGGEAIALPARVAQVAATAALFDRLGGVALAVDTLHRRAGRSLDPDLAAAMCGRAQRVLGELAEADVVVAAPGPGRPDGAAARSAAPGRRGAVQPPDRRAPGRLAAHRRAPRAGHLRAHRRLQPRGRRAVRDGARPALKTGRSTDAPAARRARS